MFFWWWLTSLSTRFQLFRGGQLYWWRKQERPGENHRPVATIIRSWPRRPLIRKQSYTSKIFFMWYILITVLKYTTGTKYFVKKYSFGSILHAACRQEKTMMAEQDIMSLFYYFCMLAYMLYLVLLQLNQQLQHG